jgi:hypothetical protein
MFSLKSNHSAPIALKGAGLTRPAFVFVRPGPAAVRSVVFTLDPGTPTAIRAQRSAPFDFGAADANGKLLPLAVSGMTPQSLRRVRSRGRAVAHRRGPPPARPRSRDATHMSKRRILFSLIALIVAQGPAYADATAPAPRPTAAEGPTVALLQSIADGTLPAEQFFSRERGTFFVADYGDAEVDQPYRDARPECKADTVRSYMPEPVDYARRFTCRPSGHEWVCTGRILTDSGGASFASLYFVRAARGHLLLDRMVECGAMPLSAQTLGYLKKQRARRKPCR